MFRLMKLVVLVLAVIQSIHSQSKTSPADFWKDYTREEKVAFINGAYGAIAIPP